MFTLLLTINSRWIEETQSTGKAGCHNKKQPSFNKDGRWSALPLLQMYRFVETGKYLFSLQSETS